MTPMLDDVTLLQKQPDSMTKLHFYCLIILLFFSLNPRNSKHDILMLSLFNLMITLIYLLQIWQKINCITAGLHQQILINLNLKLLAKYLNSFIISKQAITFIFIKMAC